MLYILIQGNNLDMPINNVLGMEGFLRLRDLPGFCRCDNLDDETLQYVVDEAQQNFRADALMFNTFEELESPVLDHIREKIPRLYAVGPLHAHLRSRSPHESGGWKDESNCVEWLNNQPAGSVVYVSFGSVVFMASDQFLELWHGLVNSGKSFLWVVRPGSISGKGWTETLPDELMKATGEMGRMVEWAPQEEVLGHTAVGAFLTHAGWNSVLESITAGLPMICWPLYADQFLNARFVSQVWKVGLDMKDSGCDRAAVERAVTELLDERKDEFRGSAEKLKRLAASHWRNESPGGSKTSNNSISCLDRLIQGVRTMCP